VHRSPAAHACAHAPQFAASAIGSTQWPAHSSEPAAHPATQPPLRQVSPRPQMLPQRPQWFGSVAVSTHRPTHNAIGHPLVRHVPSMHAWPLAQRLPHDPQFALSERESTQVPPQIKSGARHPGGAQTPSRQISPEAHAWPQRPQLRWSDPNSTQPAPQAIIGAVQTMAGPSAATSAGASNITTSG
jgi:hypothetical protein